MIEQRYECVLADDAFCVERPGTSVDSEYRRQSRITNRTLRALWRHARLLNPLRFGMFSFFLFSHKVMRFTAPLFLLTSGVALVSLAALGEGPYQLVTGFLAIATLLLARMVVRFRAVSIE